MSDWNAPMPLQRWMARHSRAIVAVCLVVVVLMIALGIGTWIDEEDWWRGLGPIFSTAGFLSFAYAARECRKLVDAYDERSRGDER